MLKRALCVDHVTKVLRQALQGFIGAKSAVPVMSVAGGVLHGMVSAGVINSFKIDNIIELGIQKVLQETNHLPKEARPGDQFIVETVMSDGSTQQDLQGIVIASDGEGNGTVFYSNDGGSVLGEIRVQCSIRPSFPIEYIKLEAVIDS